MTHAKRCYKLVQTDNSIYVTMHPDMSLIYAKINDNIVNVTRDINLLL